MAQLDPAELLQTAVRAGWSTTPSPDLVHNGVEYSPAEFIAALASAESGGNTNEVNPGGGSDSEVSIGLLQLNAVGGIGSTSALKNLGLPDYSPQALTDPLTNFKVALADYNASIKSGASPLAALQGPWAAELGAPGGSLGNTANGTGSNYNAFIGGLLPYATQRISYVGSTAGIPGESSNLVGHAGTYSFAQIEQLIQSRGGGIGTAGSGAAVTSPSAVTGSGGGATTGGSTGTSTAAQNSSSSGGFLSGGSFLADILRDIEIAALVVGAAAGLFLAVSHIAQGGVSIPGTGSRISIAGGTPELWWIIGSASVLVLWSIFSKQNPWCVLTHMTSANPGGCAGTLQGGTVVEDLIAAFAGAAILKKLFPNLPTVLGGGKGSGSDTSTTDTGTTDTGTGTEGDTSGATTEPEGGLPTGEGPVPAE